MGRKIRGEREKQRDEKRDKREARVVHCSSAETEYNARELPVYTEQC